MLGTQAQAQEIDEKANRKGIDKVDEKEVQVEDSRQSIVT